ncbi:transcriptional regulator, RpiR family [Candidatus Moduliflexus flocculans]|uniref:Transcriptional regulator, RpiR family n=1 Tax=Candidatus Moduliflexus flocculans TaxID=1499966 RepID=A0A0S6VSM7_9BACT|nr:transcriptional regulator, RpiR family [Candidatus Moduliflexus flocculans]
MGETPITQEQQPSVLQAIRTKLPEMTQAQQQIARYILAQPARVLKMSISELAQATDTKSESAVVRFYKVIGFSGYNDFRVDLATEIAGKSFYYSYDDMTASDDVGTVKEKMFQGIMRMLHENMAHLHQDALQRAVDILLEARRIVFLGYGTAGIVAFDGFFKFSELGFNCHYSADPHVNAILLTEPQEGDVLFCVSYSGENRDILIQAGRAKPIAKVIALSGGCSSPLGEIADVCLVTVSDEKNYRTDVMIARIIQLAVLDTLYIAVGLRKGTAIMDRLTKTRHALSYLKFSD